MAAFDKALAEAMALESGTKSTKQTASEIIAGRLSLSAAFVHNNHTDTDCALLSEAVVPVEGVEPPTHRLRSDCSTTELHRR